MSEMGRRIGGLLLLATILPAWKGAFEERAVWLDVPFVKQQKYGCGAACIAMVLQYWSRAAGESPQPDAEAAWIMKRLYSSRAKGIFASDMEHFFREAGFETFAFKGEWLDLQRHLSKGRPLIVSLKDNPGENQLHYAVVTGVDPPAGMVLLNDPARRKLLKMDRESFEKRWNAAANWTLLAVPTSRR